MSFDLVIFDNTLGSYTWFLGVVAAGMLAVYLAGRIFIKWLGRGSAGRSSEFAELMLQSIKNNLKPAAYIIVLQLSLRMLKINPAIGKILAVFLTAAAAVLGASFISSLLVFLFRRHCETKQKNSCDARNELAVKWLAGLIRFLVWALAAALFLDNIGIKINSLIAGLGIGGVAIAFASQSIISDIFCFFTIFFDRPFEIGDYIKVGEYSGIVEHIGVKTTRLRALGGEQLVFSNTDLTSARLQNYKTLTKRRAVLQLAVSYDTSVDAVAEIPAMIKTIVEATPNAQFSRAHFASFGSYSLNIEVVYFVLSGDYTVFMDTSQAINLKIKQSFEQAGIAFALPLQDVRLWPQNPQGQGADHSTDNFE